MVRITAEINGKKYELVKEEHLCDGCSFKNESVGAHCSASIEQRQFCGVSVCAKLHGIWKEVKDEDND